MMTTDEQRGLLHAIRASLYSALGGLDLYLRRLEGEGAAWDDGQDDDDDEGAGPSDVTGVAAALSTRCRSHDPPNVGGTHERPDPLRNG